MSYQELKERPNYWTIEKQMVEHKAIKARCDQLEEENKQLRQTKEITRVRETAN
jgi:hypothetical protein